MIAALFAFAAALLVAGWWVLRSSRRAARPWAALALAALAGANAIQIVQAQGPWWPLLHRPWSLAEDAAVLAWLTALALAWRTRGWRAGQVLLVCGVAAFVFALAAATIGQSASERARLCPGQTTKMDRWTAGLHSVEPALGADYTGIESRLAIFFPDGGSLEARPQLRDHPLGSPGQMAGSQVLERWNGELLVESIAHSISPECAELRITWQPFAQWLRYGAWAILAGALLLLAGALRSAGWRKSARGRIAMRREDQGRESLAASAGSMGWRPLALALICGAIAFTWHAGQQTPHGPIQLSRANGAAMVAARQAQFGGPHQDNRWLVIADALARHDQFGEAAEVLLGDLAQQPGNAEAWLALGDALYGHAGGRMVAAAQLAYVRADRTATPQPSAKSVAAQAMAASGRQSDAELWVCRDYPANRQCPD